MDGRDSKNMYAEAGVKQIFQNMLKNNRKSRKAFHEAVALRTHYKLRNRNN